MSFDSFLVFGSVASLIFFGVVFLKIAIGGKKNG